MNFTFHKYHGTGNDFIIFDNRLNNIILSDRQVRHLCNRRFGIGADGLMLLNIKEGYDFEMLYYNADGNESSMCGNGGRCLVKFAHEAGIRKTNYFFTAADGEHEATIDESGWVNLKMKDVDRVKQHLADKIVDTGSPHYIKSISDVLNYNVVKVGRDIRYGNGFKHEGINVNFVEGEGDGRGIFVRTYERGVEDETLSCGTGVTAAALIYAHNDNGFNRVEVRTLGGNLAVEFEKVGDAEFKNIWLCGPAEFVFKGEVDIN
jgi:diaminopimelate epimerase